MDGDPKFDLKSLGGLVRLERTQRGIPYLVAALDGEGKVYGWNVKRLFEGLAERVGEPVTETGSGYTGIHLLTKGGRVLTLNADGGLNPKHENAENPAVKIRSGGSTLLVQTADGVWRHKQGMARPHIADRIPVPDTDPKFFPNLVESWEKDGRPIIDVACYSIGHAQWIAWIEEEETEGR